MENSISFSTFTIFFLTKFSLHFTQFFSSTRTKYIFHSLKTMLKNINFILILFWFGIPLPGYCMERCTVRQERTLRENPTVSSGDPSCSDSWTAAVETKSSSSWKWCLRTLSILSQVYSVISAHMYNMCTMEFLVWIKKNYITCFLELKVYSQNCHLQKLMNFLKNFIK